METVVDINFKEIIPKFDEILSRGLCRGIGTLDGQMCIEAAVCASMDLPFGDEPECVATSVRSYKIRINDAKWESAYTRAKALRDIGIAQIGSKNIIDDDEFVKRLSTKTIQTLIVHLFRNHTLLKKNLRLQELIDTCEKEPTCINCRNAAAAVYAADAAVTDAAVYAAAVYAAAVYAADAAAAAAVADATYATYAGDFYLIMSVNLALEVLKELNSPGCKWI